MADKPPNTIAEILEAWANREGPPSPVELETYYRAFPNILHNALAIPMMNLFRGFSKEVR